MTPVAILSMTCLVNKCLTSLEISFSSVKIHLTNMHELIHVQKTKLHPVKDELNIFPKERHACK